MKTLCFALLVLLTAPFARAEDKKFQRPLPSPALLTQLTPDRFKNQDAVIILKEQAFTIYTSNIFYRGYELSGLSTTRAKIMIVKLLTQSGAERYGSYEYSYPEWYGDEFPCTVEVRVRVMKEDGSIWVMPEKDVQTIVSLESKNGTPLERKVLFKVPDLKAGDVLQIEQMHTEPMSRTGSGIFFYNDRDPVLFSNLAITLPAEDNPRYYSFPEERIGPPKTSQAVQAFGEGETYFWSVKNLNGIPTEPCGLPFADLSLMTAFVVGPRIGSGKPFTDWNSLAEAFSAAYLDKDKISDARVAELGFLPRESDITMEKVDKLYASLRKSISLRQESFLFPMSKDIDQVFEKKTGHASDLAYIMYTILKQWQQNADVVWIRDRRNGAYEESVPTLTWFDRMGVLARIGNQEKVYDFDRCIPAQFDMPWFLSGIRVPVLSKSSCYHKELHDASGVTDHYTREQHMLRFGEGMALTDSVALESKGTVAENFRNRCYEDDRNQVQLRLRDIARAHCLSSPDTVWCNNILEEPVAEMHFVGQPITPSTQVESFVTFRLSDHSLEAFYEKLATVGRVNDIVLEEPTCMSITWHVTVPNGYTVQQCPEAFSTGGPCKMTGSVRVTKSVSAVDIAMDLQFPQIQIPQPNFRETIGFLEKMRAAVGKDVVLRKL